MPESDDAAWLREHWNREVLGQYDGKWIAVLRSEIRASGSSVEEVLSKASDAGEAPLFAFVVLGPLQP